MRKQIEGTLKKVDPDPEVCEHCGDYMSWCKCPEDCAEGNHNFSQSFRCQCGVTRYKLMNKNES